MSKKSPRISVLYKRRICGDFVRRKIWFSARQDNLADLPFYNSASVSYSALIRALIS